MMNVSDRQVLRKAIGESVISAQKIAASGGATKEEVLVEIIAALLSLSAYVSRHNAGVSRLDFMLACEGAASEQWPKGEDSMPASWRHGFDQ